MKELLEKYGEKLVSAGLADKGSPLVGGLDSCFEWNRDEKFTDSLEKIFYDLNINSLLFSRPSEPYRSIIDYLAKGTRVIRPNDCETRTFLHDLPVVNRFDVGPVIRELRRRKSVIIPEKGIITWGTVSPEQAFIFYSSTCFACFVKFFSDFLVDSLSGSVTDEQQKVFDTAVSHLYSLPENPSALMKGPFKTGEQVKKAISEVGYLTVKHRLVDSFFGNVSCLLDGTLYISQTTSSLDELEGCIDACPLDGSSCVGITASSEYTAHREVLMRTWKKTMLHGHPKFSVILSMHCTKKDCKDRGNCHIKCPEKRFVEDIPIVPGEVGTGPRGLCRTLPPAMMGRRGVIVYGHGLFTTGTDDFNEAFSNLLDIEKMCRDRYLGMVKDLI